MEKDAGYLTPEDCRDQLDDLAAEAYSKPAVVRNLAFQLASLNRVGDLCDAQQIDEAREEFKDFAEDWGVNLNKPLNIFHRGISISHPLAQALTIDLITKVNEKLDSEEIQQLQRIRLAVCYHLLPDDQLYKIRALVECLESFASFISGTDEDGQARTLPVWEAAAQLAKSIGDPITERLGTEHGFPATKIPE